MNFNEIQRKLLDIVIEADPDTLKRLHAACDQRRKPKRLGTVKQAASILGVCTRTIDRYEQKGVLTAVRISQRLRRFDLDEVARVANEGVEI